ncbi:7TM GPCR, serpentine receptor class e (Sre) family-containing protein [Strongyloides ratti]|uniref:7TM GPCR, serpentine receptor class e (Sre) family-containing protein n=1 Tax=Strongyloides ratti TaxID=34506 RepID=A0A090LN59_STRRB|nr:7TM GPCR, serpentine receptor class e (Sre) family-containing protein [Strongyloides ratti]CEF69609.1 7TM GPCR, serpentine receptor class e (Sre) family-containing protein [Strongyloides ratti]
MNNKLVYSIIDIHIILITLLMQCIIIMAIISLKKQSQWHINFRFNILLSIIIIDINTFLEVIICILNICFGNNLRESSYYPWKKIFIICREWQLNMNNYYRYTQWTIIIERLISTIYIENYEKKTFRLYPFYNICFISIATYITVMIPKFFNFFDDRHIMYIFIDIPICITFYILYIKNKNLKFNIKNIEKSLSNKYQVNENIFIMWLFFPIITLHIIQQFLLHLFAILIRFMNITTDEYFLIVYAIRIHIFLVTLITITFVKKLRKYFDGKNIFLQNKKRLGIVNFKNSTKFLKNTLTNNQINANQTKMYFEIFYNKWNKY